MDLQHITNFRSMGNGQEKEMVCPTHGKYVAKSFFHGQWTGCPECAKAKEQQFAKSLTKKMQADYLQAERENFEKCLGRSGIAPRFARCTIDNFQAPTPAMQAVKHFAQQYVADFASVMQTGRCAIFSGSKGTGKNHLACGIASAVIKKGYHAAVITVDDMVMKIKETYGNKGSSELQMIEFFVKPDLLILDEFGMGTNSDTERRLLFSVINKRYEHLKPTIVLTNLSADDFRAQIEPRVRDRLRDNGGKLLPFNWESWRNKDFHDF